MSQYPKAKYHAKEPNRCVQNAEEEAALGEGWFDHPNLVHAKPEPKAELTVEVVDTVKRGPGRPPKYVPTDQSVGKQ